MYKIHKSLLTSLLLVSSFDTSALGINGSQINNKPEANDDHQGVVVGNFNTASGNVGTNDLYGTTFVLNGSGNGQYGVIKLFDSGGEYTYELFQSTTNESLPSGGGTDRFQYTVANDAGTTDTAWLIIEVSPDQTPTTARDDDNTVVSNKTPSVTGDVTSNDSNGDYVSLSSSPSSDYGILTLLSDGSYTYDLYETAPSVFNLKAGEVVEDEFDYKYFANSGESSKATLTIQIIGNPVDENGVTIFPSAELYDNVDVEFNNRSAQATSLNSGRNIKGHLYNSGDKDWYSLASAGDEIITLEVCPKGTSCFSKKSWVLYVFDSDLLTKAMEERTTLFRRWVDETGSTEDLSETRIISGFASPSESNHMYLSYRMGYFDGALIGVVDPCFDTLNTVDIGVGEGARNYLIAISSPLKGTGDTEASDSVSCGQGSVILERDGGTAAGREASTIETRKEPLLDADGNVVLDVTGKVVEVEIEVEEPGKPKSYDTTEEYITASPNSDDQYAIKITGTGLNPLSSGDAEAKPSSFNWDTGIFEIPKVRIGNEVYQTTLKQRSKKSRSTDNTLEFILSDIQQLEVDEIVDAYRATYNPENQLVMIPRVTDTINDKAYSVILKYHGAKNDNPAWLEVISVVEIL